jgi:hypothetical protein
LPGIALGRPFVVVVKELRQLLAQALVPLGLVSPHHRLLEQALLNLLRQLAPQIEGGEAQGLYEALDALISGHGSIKSAFDRRGQLGRVLAAVVVSRRRPSSLGTYRTGKRHRRLLAGAFSGRNRALQRMSTATHRNRYAQRPAWEPVLGCGISGAALFRKEGFVGQINRLPDQFPEGTRYIIEGRAGRILSRYLEFPDGRHVDLPADHVHSTSAIQGRRRSRRAVARRSA